MITYARPAHGDIMGNCVMHGYGVTNHSIMPHRAFAVANEGQ